MIISVNGVEAKTATLWNNDTPEFPETLTLELGEDCEYPITVDVKIWDEDKKSADDLAATTQFTIEADGKGTHADDAMKPQVWCLPPRPPPPSHSLRLYTRGNEA